MTSRQRETLGFLMQGLSDKEIAEQLGCATRTVKMYKTELFRLFGIDHKKMHARVRLIYLASLPMIKEAVTVQ